MPTRAEPGVHWSAGASHLANHEFHAESPRSRSWGNGQYIMSAAAHRRLTAQAFFKDPGLCAACLPSSVSTRYSGLSLDAATWCPLMSVALVNFFTTLPCAVPP